MIDEPRRRESVVVIDLNGVTGRAADITPIEGDVLARREAGIVGRADQARSGQWAGRHWVYGQRGSAVGVAVVGCDSNGSGTRDGA